MSTEYLNITNDYIPANKSSGKIEKGLKRLLIIAAVIFTAQLIWLFGISPFIPFSTVEVNGFDGINRTEILALAGIDETSSFISTSSKLVQERVASHILVESAVVIKRFPDRISIYLEKRKAAAVALTTINSRQVPIFLDRNGVFFKTGQAEPDNFLLPVLSGIDNPQLNMRLPSSLIPLAENLGQIAKSSPELLSAISEIRIEPKTWDGFDLVLFPVHSSIRVRIENNLTEDTLRYMLLMLSVFDNDVRSGAGRNGSAANLQKPQEIDFRSGMGSYRIGELSL